jgi:hypothetical protein
MTCASKRILFSGSFDLTELEWLGQGFDSLLGAPFSRLSSPGPASRRSDVNINGGDTYQIAETLAARDIPFVFSTGYGKNSLRAPYHNRPILQKPFQRDDLQKLFSEAFP